MSEAQGKGPDAQRLLDEARLQLDLGQSAEALRLLQKLTDWYPGNAEGWCLVTRAFFLLEDFTRAHRAADLAMEADPCGAEGYAWKCRLHAQASQWDAGMLVVQQGLEMTYQDVLLQQWRIRLLMGGDRLSEAMRTLSQVPKESQDAGWSYLWAESARRQRFLPEAEAHCLRALALDPSFADAWACLAGVHLAQRRSEEMLSSIQRAIQVSGGSPDLAPRTVEVFDRFLRERVLELRWLPAVTMPPVLLFAPGWLKLACLPVGLLTYLAADTWRVRRQRELLLREVGANTYDFYREHKRRAVRDKAGTESCGWGCVLIPIAVVALMASFNPTVGWMNVGRGLLVATLALIFAWTTVSDRRGKRKATVAFRFPGEAQTAEEVAALSEEREGAVGEGPEEPAHPDLVRFSQELFGQGKLGPATVRAREAVASDPESLEALTQLSFCQMVLGEHEEGETVARAAVAAQPEDPRGHAHLWVHMVATGRVEAVREAARAAPGTLEGAGRVLVACYQTLRWIGSKETAEALRSLIHELLPESWEAHLADGHWALHSNNLPQAEAALRRGLALNPESQDLHAGLSWLLARRWRFRQASAAARRALALDPAETSARANLEGYLNLVLLALTLVLGLLAALWAALPTLLGAPSNSHMVLSTFLAPFGIGALMMLSARPLAAVLFPGMQFQSGKEGDSGGLDGTALFTLSLIGSLLVSLVVHSLQAWLEILLHPDLFRFRWPGAATVTALTLFVAWLVSKMVRR